MKRLIFALLLLSSSSFAIHIEPDLAQSSPSLRWFSIENDFVRVIYPESIKSESVYIANLVEHYSQFVGQSYGIAKPHQFNLVIRPEMGTPNGYVTLAPRRSEWFASSMFFPLVGTTEWYQTLSIHEYRHVNQFDHFNSGGTRVLYYLMGEAGWQVAVGLSLPSWYMEGDAVWAETKYTDGGRGRSPRFISRMKALLLSQEIPTYDQFLSGTYKTNTPNQYVYGYALVSYAVQKFGEDVWEKVTRETARFPYPMRFYRAFENITDQDFEEFYYEAMQDLKKKWSADAFPANRSAWTEYREQSSPIKRGDTLYYVSQTLNTHAQVVREANGKKEVVFQFPYNRELQLIDIRGSYLAYTQFLPDERYGHKGSSDLFLLNLDSGSKTKLTDDQRIYNPRFNGSLNKIVAIEFAADQSWRISEFDLSGKKLNSFALAEGKVTEASYLDDDTLVAVVNNKTGDKFIAVVDLKTQKITKTLVPASRNLINAISVDQHKNIFFEAQYKGANEVFKLSTEHSLSLCTKSKLGSYTPFSDGTKLYVTEEDINGSLVKSQSLAQCKELAINEIVAFNYLGDTASDAYNKFPLQSFPEQESLFTKNADKYQPEEYGDFDSQLFVPHSWGLTLGRSSGLGIKTDNYLRTLGFSGVLGTDAEEGTSFAELNFDIKKYYPLIRLQIEDRNRKVKDFATTDVTEWEEQAGGVAILFPFIKKRGLQNFAATFSVEGSALKTLGYKLNQVSQGNNTQSFFKTGTGLGLTWHEDATERSIIAPWLVSYSVNSERAHASENTGVDAIRMLQQGQINTPGVFSNDGLKLTFDSQDQDASATYRFLPDSTAIGYAFSRGYEYKDVSFFEKVTGNYVFPIMYPDFNLGRWIYFKRVYGTAFFDSTFVKVSNANATLNSYGLELLFESKIFSFLPIVFGARGLQRLDDNIVKGESFLATDIGF